MQNVVSARGEGAELTWVKPKMMKRQFELHEGDATLATLSWGRGSRAVAQWGEMRYQFNRQGWFRPRILIRTGDSDEVDAIIATFTQRGGLLSFPGGRSFFWKKPKWLTSERIWTDSAATELVRFHPARRATTVATARLEAADEPELPLLILLGQYLIVLAAQDAEDASTAAAVASVVATS